MSNCRNLRYRDCIRQWFADDCDLETECDYFVYVCCLNRCRRHWLIISFNYSCPGGLVDLRKIRSVEQLDTRDSHRCYLPDPKSGCDWRLAASNNVQHMYAILLVVDRASTLSFRRQFILVFCLFRIVCRSDIFLLAYSYLVAVV